MDQERSVVIAAVGDQGGVDAQARQAKGYIGSAAARRHLYLLEGQRSVARYVIDCFTDYVQGHVAEYCRFQLAS
jgi:hypothetical protein